MNTQRGATLPPSLTETFRPSQVVEIEMSAPISELRADQGRSGPYGAAHVLVRLHGSPVGVVRVDLTAGPCSEEALRRQVEDELGPALRAHLVSDATDDPADAGDDAAPAGPVAVPRCRTSLDLAPDTPKVSVLIATCRRPEQLDACIRSVLASSHPNFEIVVVDNSAGDDKTRTLVSERFGTDPRVRYVEEPVPGTSRARNMGLSVVSGEIIAITDDDVEVDRDWLRTMTSTLLADPEVACVTGLTQPFEMETAPQVWFEQFSGMSMGYSRRVFDLSMDPLPTLLFPYTPAVGGSNNMAVRASVARELGGFDVRLGPGTPTTGGEDLDLFVRILLEGHRIVYEPRAIVWHKHRRGEDELRRHVFGYGAGAVAVLTKWFVRRGDLRSRAFQQAPRLPSRAGSKGRAIGGDTTVPPGLARAQLAGLLCGPILWFRSAARVRFGR